jgi:glycosyltransferase involved in cell wall biosynthesis
MSPRALRVFIGPCEIAGQYRNLALALLQQGMKCEYYTFYQHEFSYGCDIGPSSIPYYMRKVHSYGRRSGDVLRRFACVLLFEMLRIIFFIKSIFRYDIYYFGFGLSLLRWNIDLPIIKLLGRKIIANLSHGSDMTPCYLDGALMDSNSVMPPVASLIRGTFVKKRMVARFERNASVIIGSPLSSSFLATRAYVDIIKLGRLCQAQFTDENSQAMLRSRRQFDGRSQYPGSNACFHIMHIPSHGPGKGSAVLRKMMERICTRYPWIRYTELSGLPNSEVLEHLQEADLLIDQLYSDLPLSGVGMEAYSMGVPVLICGYGLLPLKERYPENIFPPCIFSVPDRLEDTLNKLIMYPEILDQHREWVQEFMDNVWSKEAVARRYEKLFKNNEIEDDLLHDPRSVIYTHGYGLVEMQSKEMVRRVLDFKGVWGLGLGHRAELVEAMVNYATEEFTSS